MDWNFTDKYKKVRHSAAVVGAVLILFVLFALPAKGQFTTVDWGLHDVGKFTEMVNNRGSLHSYAFSGFDRLIHAEFPRGSLVEHHDAVAPFYASLSANKQDTMVSTVAIWAWQSSDEMNGYSSAPWDSVWEIERGDTANIPYKGQYTPHSDQDFVTRYNDYNQASIQTQGHDPQFIDIYQTSWTWASKPLDQFAIFNIDVIPTQKPLHEFWTGIFFNPAVGYAEGTTPEADDYITYHPKHNMLIAHDSPGNEGPEAYSPMGLKLMPPQNWDKSNLDWTFNWGYSGDLQVPRDKQRYNQLSTGNIQSDQQLSGNATALISFGAKDSLMVQDTMRWQFATIYAHTTEELLEKSKLIDRLGPEFNVPSPPPAPKVKVETSSRQVVLTWGDRSEDYTDPHRSDSVEQPFEGYRVYKSTKSSTGPWTLLAEYDLPDNEFGQNTGIKHRFKDTGLMNNVEYYYAVTAFSKRDTVLNFPSQESSPESNALEITPGTAPPENVGEVAVVPNPYRGDVDYNSMNPPWERPPESRDRWLEQDRRIQFINLPANSTIKIYTLSGQLVETLEHNNADRGFEDWNLTSSVNQAVASGIYLFTVTNNETGDTQTGKFVIIK